MIRIKKVKPLFTNIITTGDKFTEDMTEQGIITAKKGDLKLWQKVIAVGSTVRDINVGDMVMINPANYMVRKFSKDSIQNDLDNNPVIRYQFNWVTMENEDGKLEDFLLLHDRDISYVFEGEEVKDNIIIPDKKLLLS